MPKEIKAEKIQSAAQDATYKIIVPNMVLNAFTGEQVDIGREETVSLTSLQAQKAMLEKSLANVNEQIAAVNKVK